MRQTTILSIAALAATLCCITQPALAAERGFYVGAGWSDVSGDYSTGQNILLATPGPSDMPQYIWVPNDELDPVGSRAVRALAGYRALDWLAIEADFGNFSGNSALTGTFCVDEPCPYKLRSDAKGTTVALLAILPLSKVELFARAGLMRWDADIAILDGAGTRMDTLRGHDTDVTFGAGVQMPIGNLGVRLQVERLRFGADRADAASLAVTYRFGK